MYHYQFGIAILMRIKYSDQKIYSALVPDKGTKLEFTDEENTMLAISSLAIVFSIIEIILAFASAKSCSGLSYEPPEANQVCLATEKQLFELVFFVYENRNPLCYTLTVFKAISKTHYYSCSQHPINADHLGQVDESSYL